MVRCVGFLTIFGLQVAPHQSIELLVGSAQLKSDFSATECITLHQRVQNSCTLMGVPALNRLVKSSRSIMRGHGVARSQLNHACAPNASHHSLL